MTLYQTSHSETDHRSEDTMIILFQDVKEDPGAETRRPNTTSDLRGPRAELHMRHRLCCTFGFRRQEKHSHYRNNSEPSSGGQYNTMEQPWQVSTSIQ